MQGARMLGAQIRKRRNELGLSPKEVAEQIGCSLFEYHSVENGICLTTYKGVEKIADTLMTTVEQLLELMPFPEYKLWILNRPDLKDEEEFDALLDYIEDMIMLEIERAEERIEDKLKR